MAHKGKSQSSGNSTLNSGTQPPRISPRLTRVTFIPEFEGGGTLAKPQLDAGGVNQWQNTFLVCARLGFHPNTAKIKKKNLSFGLLAMQDRCPHHLRALCLGMGSRDLASTCQSSKGIQPFPHIPVVMETGL
jgi:hypothetical protein